MLTKRIIPCLDVKNGSVVKGIKFKNHEIVGSILDLAKKYNNEGADELVFYDIGASTYDGTVSKEWIKLIAEVINIPFCVAGGIKSVDDAKIKYSDALEKGLSIMPKSFAWDADPGPKPGKDGLYPCAIPGKTKVMS